MLEYDSNLCYRDYYFSFMPKSNEDQGQVSIPLFSLSSIKLRSRQSGDYISFGHFSKKIRRLFIDEKFTIAERQNAIIGEQDEQIIFVLIGNKTYLRKACKHDIMLAKLYIDKLEKG
ncbi:TPA: tRNA lysidine(34) synthetase TilS, partial [Streptococcus pyogenes]|nr:tRNA lysidine(34) synthetase TilS [Streptococcus pyogenes]HEP2543957.1 tRNA lysidine(34) synthetase TilS [Streptococcus pyogenes]HEP2567669.1 tRNA lysidine(34) synthetase TilS [Streptococcus pyogenes]HEQ8350964.1 tRNA lysidine(34) synthetase TilS [Streptococcus pyogenes]HEQ8391858.1 tRNA lysidine(34) synthetase TilS [Streptococcus pyogenes]